MLFYFIDLKLFLFCDLIFESFMKVKLQEHTWRRYVLSWSLGSKSYWVCCWSKKWHTMLIEKYDPTPNKYQYDVSRFKRLIFNVLKNLWSYINSSSILVMLGVRLNALYQQILFLFGLQYVVYGFFFWSYSECIKFQTQLKCLDKNILSAHKRIYKGRFAR